MVKSWKNFQIEMNSCVEIFKKGTREIKLNLNSGALWARIVKIDLIYNTMEDGQTMADAVYVLD